jgi:hypothetical protein
LKHTTSKYCSNKLDEIVNNETEHFIIRSYLTAAFEYDRKIAEYWLYWYNPNKGTDEENPQYRFLSNKKMNKKEVRLFYDNLTSYSSVIKNKDGDVWQHKNIGFSINKVVFKQLKFWY